MKAKRANVLLRIKDSEVDRYYDQGFDIYDDDEKLIKKAIPSDVGELKLAYVQNLKKIEELEIKIKELTKKPVKEETERKKSSKKEEE